VASSFHGEPRATRDIDIAVRLTPDKLPALVAALGPDFAVDQEMVLEAIRTGRSANIFYLPLVVKVDLFMRGHSEYDRSEFSRRTVVQPLEGEAVNASSAEDNLLWKLRWFQQGGEVSDQQWRDILGILRIGEAGLDLAYLREWSSRHGVTDLLERALAQASA
jgi:hypothetical protein